MKITIGEIVNELLPYSNMVETSTIRGFPFVRALISSNNGCLRMFMYILQYSENSYYVCDTDAFGDKYFPTGNTSKPFISEPKLIHELFNEKDEINEEKVRMVDNITFIDYLIDSLIKYDIIIFNKDDLKIKFSQMGFRNQNIVKTIDRSFTDNFHSDGTMDDLIDIVCKQRKTFSLGYMKPGDIRFVSLKLGDIGLNMNTIDNTIIGITFKKK